jgi:hypothetical protein
MKVLTTISSAFAVRAPLDLRYSEVIVDELSFPSKNWNSLLGRIEVSSPIWAERRDHGSRYHFINSL